MNEIGFLYFDREGLDRGTEKAHGVQALSMSSLHNHLSWVPHYIPKAEVKKKSNYQLGATLMSISLKSGGGGGLL